VEDDDPGMRKHQFLRRKLDVWSPRKSHVQHLADEREFVVGQVANRDQRRSHMSGPHEPAG